MSGPSWGSGGPLVYGPVSTLAECLQHVAGCEECRGRWPVVPGMLAMAWRPDGHVEFDVTATAGDQPGPIRLLPPITGPDDPRLSAEGREWVAAARLPRGDTPSDPTAEPCTLVVDGPEPLIDVCEYPDGDLVRLTPDQARRIGRELLRWAASLNAEEDCKEAQCGHYNAGLGHLACGCYWDSGPYRVTCPKHEGL